MTRRIPHITPNTILQGDALQVLSTLPDCSVQCCITSPPYFGLRNYGVDGQIGLEGTPAEYVNKLVAVFHEVRRVLKDNGTCWVNIGDSYAAGKAGRTDYGTGDPTSTLGPKRDGLPHNTRPGTVIQRSAPAGFKHKDLMMIPARVAIALCDDGWYLRSDIVWHKPTAMPESVLDRPTKAHEYIYLLTKNEHYYYNTDAIREPHTTKSNIRDRGKESGWASGALLTPIGEGLREWNHPLGRNKRSVWTVAAQPYPAAHFATFPPKLIEPMILAGSQPDDIVLDPFMGAGTTALVALQHNRRFLGIELNPDYIELAHKRISTIQPDIWSQIDMSNMEEAV